jgi:hypothetical protein
MKASPVVGVLIGVGLTAGLMAHNDVGQFAATLLMAAFIAAQQWLEGHRPAAPAASAQLSAP